jgi:hypothetical protein
MNKFYNLKGIMAKNATYNIIIGERSNGKTYSILKYGIEKFIENGGQLAIIRRWKEDITGRRASDIFTALITDGTVKKLSKGEYEGVHYYAGKFYLCTYDNNRKALFNDNDCFAYCFALSDTEHNKSISYPNIQTIFFDEFLTKHLYLNDEFILFMNTVSTIVRQRDTVKIFMAGNTVNKFCPYFQEMGLKHITKMAQGDIDVYKYGDSRLIVAVEYCNSINKSKKSNFYFAFDNPKLQMITTGKWELDLFPHIPCKYKKRDIVFDFFIVFDDNIIHGEIIQLKEDIILYFHEKTTPIKENSIVFTLEENTSMYYNKSIYKPNFAAGSKIIWLLEHGKTFYQNNDIGNTIANYLKLVRSV